MMNICLFGASSSIIHSSYVQEIEQLGREIVKRGHGLVYGAGASGLMGAAARGAYEEGGNIIGVVPDFFEDEDMGVDGKIFSKCTKLIKTESMRERKHIMEDMGDAFIIVPGGIGTFEEFFEVFTLKQLERHNKAIVILNVNGYYDPMLNLLSEAIKQGFLREACLKLIKTYDNIYDALDYIENYKPEKINVFETKNIERG